MSQWSLCLEEHGRELLKLTDGLLARYRRQRRSADSSVAGRILEAGLWRLRGFAAFLSEEEQQRFLELDQRLWLRLQSLRSRRIPPCLLLHRLYQCYRRLKRLAFWKSEDWDSPSVLVGTLRRPSQLDVCLMYGFYHVPVGQIPEGRLPLDYVAIYQSRSMFGRDCGVRFYGRVKRCTVVRRWEISEIPKSSEELYYRFEVVRWEQLDEPIRVREVPFTHLFTNLFLLTHAEETPQLFLTSPAQYCCYQAIRTAFDRGDGLVFDYSRGKKLYLKNGLLIVRCWGRRIAAFRADDFNATPGAIFRKLMDALEKKQ